MSAQLPVPIPPGITPGEAVTPSTELEVKSLGVGTTAPATEGVVALVARTATATYDTPATIEKDGNGLYFRVNTPTGKSPGSTIFRPYSDGNSAYQIVMGEGLTVDGATGVAGTISSGGRIGTKYGYLTRTALATSITLTSGTAHQVDTQQDRTVHILLEAATVAGTAKITMGPAAAGTTHVVATGLKLLAGSSQLVTVKVPVAWYLVVTVTTATIVSALAVS